MGLLGVLTGMGVKNAMIDQGAKDLALKEKRFNLEKEQSANNEKRAQMGMANLDSQRRIANDFAYFGALDNSLNPDIDNKIEYIDPAVMLPDFQKTTVGRDAVGMAWVDGDGEGDKKLQITFKDGNTQQLSRKAIQYKVNKYRNQLQAFGKNTGGSSKQAVAGGLLKPPQYVDNGQGVKGYYDENGKWKTADSTDLESMKTQKLRDSLLAQAEDFDTSQIQNKRGIWGKTIDAAIDTRTGEIVPVDIDEIDGETYTALPADIRTRLGKGRKKDRSNPQRSKNKNETPYSAGGRNKTSRPAGAKQAPDGKWYVKKNDGWYLVEE